jgi:hypothetical protein
MYQRFAVGAMRAFGQNGAKPGAHESDFIGQLQEPFLHILDVSADKRRFST